VAKGVDEGKAEDVAFDEPVGLALPVAIGDSDGARVGTIVARIVTIGVGVGDAFLLRNIAPTK
jgi:hypothetical protein